MTIDELIKSDAEFNLLGTLVHPSPRRVREINLKDMMKPKEAAFMLDVSERSVLRYLASGRLRGVRRGARGGWRISQADLDAFIRSG